MGAIKRESEKKEISIINEKCNNNIVAIAKLSQFQATPVLLFDDSISEDITYLFVSSLGDFVIRSRYPVFLSFYFFYAFACTFKKKIIIRKIMEMRGEKECERIVSRSSFRYISRFAVSNS